MSQRTTAREVGWMLTCMFLLFYCWHLIVNPLLAMCGFISHNLSGMPDFLIGCVFGAVGAGIGLGVGMHLEHILSDLKQQSEHDETAKQLLEKYQQREIYAVVAIWSAGPLLVLLMLALSGESI